MLQGSDLNIGLRNIQLLSAAGIKLFSRLQDELPFLFSDRLEEILLEIYTFSLNDPQVLLS